MAPSSSLEALYGQVARKVLRESIALKKGESLVVETWNNGLPFARHVVVEARKLGAVPMTLLEDEDAYIEGVRKGDPDYIGSMGKHEMAMLSSSDAYVFIPGPVIGSLSRKLARKEVADSTRYNQSWYEAAAKAKLRGARLSFGYIDDEVARMLGKTTYAVVSQQLKAALTDFRKVGAKGRGIAPKLRDGARAKLTTPAGPLTFTLNGETEISDGVVDASDMMNGDSMTYVPPGYVYKQIDPSSANGRMSIAPLWTLFGRVKDAVLEFENGRLSRWSSRSSPKTLEKVIGATAEQTRLAGGLFIGLNPDLKYGYGQNTFVGGTVTVRCPGIPLSTVEGTLDVNGDTIVEKGRLR